MREYSRGSGNRAGSWRIWKGKKEGKTSQGREGREQSGWWWQWLYRDSGMENRLVLLQAMEKTRRWELLCGKDLSKTQSLDLAQLFHFSCHQPRPGSLCLISRFFMTSLLDSCLYLPELLAKIHINIFFFKHWKWARGTLMCPQFKMFCSIVSVC